MSMKLLSSEESLAHRVCLLLVELHLCTFQLEKALSLIAYIENQFVSTETVISSDKDMKPLEKEHKEKKVLASLNENCVCPHYSARFVYSVVTYLLFQPVSVDAATDAFHLKLLQYRARCYLLTHSLKACKREIKNVVTSGGRVSTADVAVGCVVNRLRFYYPDLKLRTDCYNSSAALVEL